MTPDLKAVLPAVESQLQAAEADLGPPSGELYWTRRKAVTDQLVAGLKDSVGARISAETPTGCTVRIAGVSSSCTAGTLGAVRNWINAARRKLAVTA